MAFMRSKTASTLKSQQWSTDEIGHGLMHILTDGRLELPDDAAQLQDHCSVEIPGLYHGQFKEQTQNKYTEGV